MKSELVTYTGKAFDLLNPKPEMVCIEDIAHSLAYQCRYTGHTREFYSVAQHCVLMSENKDLPGDPLQKLLHDAAEAYTSDLARPFKKLVQVNIYEDIKQCLISAKEFELRIQDVIGVALGINMNESAEVKKADGIMIATEIRDLMPAMPPDFDWGVDLSTVVGSIINSWTVDVAELRFLNRYFQLTKE